MDWKSTDNAFDLNVDNLVVLQSLQLKGSGLGSLAFDSSAVSLPYTWKYPATVGGAGQVLTSQAGGTMTWTTVSGGGGSGTVTSVGMTVPTFLSVSPSTITTSGTFSLSLSGTALPVLNGGTGTTTSTGTGSNVLSSSPVFSTGASNAISLVPATTDTECAILFNSQTTSGTGARWVIGQNVAGGGADTFAIYSTTSNKRTLQFNSAGTRATFATNVSAIQTSGTDALELYPLTNNTQVSIMFNSLTAGSGARWALGQNVGGNGADTFGLYSTTFNNTVLWFSNTGQATFNAPIWSNGLLSGGTRFHIYFFSGATQTGRITDNGSTVTYFSASDYRIKTDIQPIQNPLSKLVQLKPCTYTFTGTQVLGEGFLAHEIQDIIPTAVSGYKDEVDEDDNPVIQGVDYSKVTPLLTAALQELTAIVEQQQQTISQILATMNM